ncbi:TIGR02452 family protein [Lysobacter hankyongensis]|uniref:TIGR02452 family protein n=1 Tax=Lysobacter hankyongensis TaxID=1176535 RepID=A0ABP9AFM8_9GAMM
MSGNRGARERLAQETLRILDARRYETQAGRAVDLDGPLSRCLTGTRLHEADEIARMIVAMREVQGAHDARIEVVNETTLVGLSALLRESDEPVAVLNFASAKNPGGGFLGGSQAQEESLARSSALYASLSRCDAFYAKHRASSSLLYSDAMILSPACPVFRDDHGALLEAPMHAGFITSAAPNAGAIAQTRPDEWPLIESTFVRRAEGVLALAAQHGYRNLVLGAWGCGVFRNDPAMVARVFADHLLRGPWRHHFERVRFSVLDNTGDGATFAAFRHALYVD